MQNRIGRYTNLELIAQGSQGTVYKALDPTLGRTVAIKIMPQPVRPGKYGTQRQIKDTAQSRPLIYDA